MGQHLERISLMALPTPTVFASFPNIALSFIRVAMFFLQEKLVNFDRNANSR
jgi:hypothetical protein